ncbi:hypothetical protein sm9_0482 [Methanobrevibacter millerae]|uniref:Uncharacterized protein n=1 Tax=Methanobrevibacter millerae TaxID=230361 RepID=A0A0U3CIA9_9EURY|nr:hypothetical protein sm9_0482 [Methanobrevibacter millerae]
MRLYNPMGIKYIKVLSITYYQIKTIFHSKNNFIFQKQCLFLKIRKYK